MKKTGLLGLGLLLTTSIFAQDPAIMEKLAKKYQINSNNVRYYEESNQYRIEKNGASGICDGTGKELLAPTTRYTYITPEVHDGVLLGYETTKTNDSHDMINSKHGYCDTNFVDIIKPDKYCLCYPEVYKGKILAFNIATGSLGNSRKGYCDPNGVEIITPGRYDQVVLHNKGDQIDHFRVYRNGKEGLCDKNGREIIPPAKYSGFSTIYYNDSILGYHTYIGEKSSEDCKRGFCDPKGKEIIVPKYSNIDIMTIKRKLVGFGVNYKKNGTTFCGFCDITGKEVIAPKYRYVIFPTEDEGSLFYIGNMDGVLWNENYQIVIQGYDFLGDPSEGLCGAKKGNKWGFVSTQTGKAVIPIKYDSVGAFRDGVAMVYKKGNSELISNPLRTIVENKGAKAKGKAVSTFPAADSDVDKNIPDGRKADDNTYAFIIANENYPAAKVPYALNDGWTFEKYCKQTLGISDENVHLFEDATGGNIAACVEQMKQVAKAAGGQATLIFYYAGHAFPDEETKSGYLLPIDGDSKNITTGYSLEKLYKELNSVASKQVVCFIDACFSGATRDDQMLVTGRGVAVKVKDEMPQGNMVVMTSATGAETAHQYEEMHHGLFTYFLLHKLQETGGNVTLGDLSAYVTKMVKRKSVTINQKMQTPTVIPSPKLLDSWREMKL